MRDLRDLGDMETKYSPVIGLEVHVELATQSKMFCGCPAEHFGKSPNSQTCPVCLGLPGALPVPNKKAIEWTIILAQALDCQINLESHFDRKNYFYPDLPKGYQITQYERPFGEGGKIKIGGFEGVGGVGEIRIRRVHLEEDTGKLQHADGETLIDFNRSGVPLVEIVTEPDFRSIEEVDIYLKKLQRIIRYLGISNADMEKGSMRLEPSISILINNPNPNSNDQFPISNKQSLRSPASPAGLDQLPNYRVELKNINSFRFVRKALEYEIKRQTEVLEKGEVLKQETRGYDSVKNITFPQRGKEEAHDYRYFPEPDIPPIRFAEFEIRNLKFEIPELPDTKLERFQKKYGLTFYQANILTEDKNLADYYERVVGDMGDLREMGITVANWIINKKIDWEKETAQEVAKKIAASQQTAVVDEKKLEKIVKQVLAANPKAVADYKSGKIAVLGYLIGQMAKLMPQADKNLVKKVLEGGLRK